MAAIEEYEALRGYRVPLGWTHERVTSERERHDIDPKHVPLHTIAGVVAWGIPLILQFDRPSCWASLDSRFEALLLGASQYEVTDNHAPMSERDTIVTSIHAAEAWCRERATFCYLW